MFSTRYKRALAGAHINNIIFGTGFLDSKADQNAIGSGYDFITKLLKNYEKN